MAHYLEFDGVDDDVSGIPEPNTDTFSIIVDFNNPNLNTGYASVLGQLDIGDSSTNGFLLLGHNNQRQIYLVATGGSGRKIITSSILADEIRHSVKATITKSTGNISLSIDGVVIGTDTAGAINMPELGFGCTDRTRDWFKGNLYSAKIEDSSGNLIHHYNPTLSAEAGGTLLIDEVGGNHGTLNGFSSNPFVYYYDFLNPSEEDTTTDNCLVFDGVNDYVEIDINSQTGNSDPIWNLKFKLANPDTAASFIRVSGNNTVGDAANRIIISGSGNEFRYYRNGTKRTWSITSNPATDVYELNVAGSQSGVELLINGVSQGFQGSGSAIGIEHDFLGVNFNTYYKGGFEYVIFYTPDDDTLNRFYDFNRTAATAPVVPELINNQNGTMVGFPEPSGYVRELASNNGVTFDGVDDYVELAAPLSYSASDDVTVTISGIYSAGIGTDYIVYSPTSFIRFEHSNNRIYWQADGSTAYADNPLIHGDAYTIKFVKLGSGTGQEILLNGVSLFSFGSARSFGITQIAKDLEGTLITVLVEDSTKTYNYNFTKTQNLTVPDTEGGNDATLVGFTNTIFRPDASNALIGYRFNGVDTSAEFSNDIVYGLGGIIEIDTTVDLSNDVRLISSDNNNYRVEILTSGAIRTGAGSVTELVNISSPPSVVTNNQRCVIKIIYNSPNILMYVNDVEVADITTAAAFSASAYFDRFVRRRNLEWYPALIHNAKWSALDGTALYNWDFTTGDTDEIIDTVGGNNADIINAPTAGYLPIVEKQVFTVGTGKDYPDLTASKAAITDTDYFYEFLLYGTMPDTGEVVFLDAGSDVLFSAGNNAFSQGGDITIPHLDNVVIKGGNSTTLRYNDLIANRFSTGNYGTVKSIGISNCHVYGSNLNRLIPNSNSSLDIQISNSVIANYRSGITTSFNTIAFYDCIIGNIGGYATSEALTSGMEVINCIGFQNDQAYNPSIPIFGSGVTGTNNVSHDTTAETLGIGTQLADINIAFNDPANGDYRILQTYADTNLVGQGWNGSDIGASFYFDGSTPPVSATDTVKVLRGSVQILGGQTSLTLQNGVDYTLEDTDDTKWYFRITNNHFTGMGVISGGGSQNPDNFTVHSVRSGADTILTRAANSNDTRVDWEIVQYTGNIPENEFIVREKGTLSIPSGTSSVTTNLPAGIVDVNDVVVLITGQSCTSPSRSDANAMLFTSVKGVTDWTATRGKNSSNSNLSYAIIEYTGTDYTVTQETFVAASQNDAHTISTPVSDITKTFIHAQFRYEHSGSSGLDDLSVRVYLQDVNTLTISSTTSTDISSKHHNVYLIQNPNISVQRLTGEMSGEVPEEEIDDVAITTVSNLELSSLGGLSATSTGAGTALPRGFINFTLSADNNVKLRQSDDGQTSRYAFEVIEWPAGVSVVSITQDFQSDWNMLSQIGQNVESKWNILSGINQDFQSDWNLLFTLDQDLQSEWNILSGINQDFQSDWDLLSEVNQNFQIEWNLEVPVVFQPVYSSFYLEFDGSGSDYVSLSNTINLTGDFRLVIQLAYNLTISTGAIIGDLGLSGFTWAGPVFGSTQWEYESISESRIGVTYTAQVGELITFEIGRRSSGTEKYVNVNGVESSIATGGTGSTTFNVLGQTEGAFNTNASLYDMKIYNATGTLIHHYNPTLSAEAGGTLLIDEVGGNHGTLVGFSADPFVYYYDFLNPSEEDTTNDNCLVLDGSNDVVETNEHLDIDWSGEDWSIEWLSSEYVGNGTICSQNLSGTASSRELQVYESSNVLRFYLYGVAYNAGITSLQSNVTYRLSYVNSTNTWSSYADGVLQNSGTLGSGTATEPTATFTICARHNGSLTSYGYFFQVKLHYLKVEKGSTVHRFYDFNRSPVTAPVVPELINGQNGTMVGFPEPSGYVKGSNGDIEGYTDGNGSYSLFPASLTFDNDFRITGSFSQTDINQTSVILKFSNGWFGTWNAGGLICYFGGVIGESPPIVANTIYDFEIKRIGSVLTVDLNGQTVITNTNSGSLTIQGFSQNTSAELHTFYGVYNFYDNTDTLIHSYDFTLGDDDEIIDTVGGNNATIINKPTAGYLPIIEKQVFTVGTGKDYPDLNSFSSAEENPVTDVHHEARLYGLVHTGGSIFHENSNLVDYTLSLVAGDNAFDGANLSDRHIDATSDGLIFGTGGGGKLIYRGLNLRGFYTRNSDTSPTFIYFYSCSFDGLDSDGTQAGHFRPSNDTSQIYLIQNCFITNYHTSVDRNTNTEIYDSVIWNCAGRYNSFEVINYSTTIAKNCLIGFDSNRFDFGNTNPAAIDSSNTVSSNNVTYDANNPSAAILTNEDIKPAFNDPDNGDYRILQTYADNNLVGQGWAGSDIAAWAYFSAIISTINKDLEVDWNILEKLNLDLELISNILNTLEVDKDLVWNLLNQVQTSTELDWNILSQVIVDNEIDWDILSSVFAENEITWSVLNTLSKDQEFDWNLLNTLSKDQEFDWDVLAKVFADAEILWDVLSEVSVGNSLNLSWSILNTLAKNQEFDWNLLNTIDQGQEFDWNLLNTLSSDQEFDWNLLNTLSSDQEFDWSILNTLAKNQEFDWNLLNTLTKNQEFDWNLLNTIAQNQEFDWSILEKVSSITELRWELLNEFVVGNNLKLDWNVLSTREFSKEFNWNLLNSLIIEKTLNWSLLNVLNSSKEFDWNLLNVINKNQSFDWNIRQLVSADKSLNWDIRELVLKSIDYNWDVLRQIQNDADLRWDLFQELQSDLQVEWDIFNSTVVSANFAIIWNMREQFSDSKTLNWDLRNTLETDQESIWNIFSLLEKDLQMSWNVASIIAREFNLSWNVLQQLQSSFSSNWDIFESILVENGITWDILAKVTNDAQLLWDILAKLETDKSLNLDWNILNSKEFDKSLLWNIRVPIGQTINFDWDLFSKINSDAKLDWNILEKLVSELDLPFNLLNSMFIEKELTWSIFNEIHNTVSFKYDINALIEKDLNVSWDSLEIVGSEIRLRWDIISDVGDTISKFTTILINNEANTYMVDGENLNIVVEDKDNLNIIVYK